MKFFATLITFFFGFNFYAQAVVFKTSISSESIFNEFNIASFDTVNFNEPSLVIIRENDSDFMFSQETISFQDFDVQPIYKDYSSEFLNHCGPLTDGLYLNRSASDVLIGRVMDTFINNYLLKQWLFAKNKD